MPRTGRPRAFDRDETLARARDLFWERGYANTSVQDLVDGLAVQRGSLYGAFGDKHALYLEAVSLYWRDNRAQLEERLRTGPVLPVVREMLLQPGVITGAADRRGCLIGTTTAQLTAADSAARGIVVQAFDEFIEILTHALRRGQDTGEVAATAPPQVQAFLVLALFQGTTLLTRAVDDAERLGAAIDLALDTLRA